jgi:NADH-quinone oxidoreductase subunit E
VAQAFRGGRQGRRGGPDRRGRVRDAAGCDQSEAGPARCRSRGRADRKRRTGSASCKRRDADQAGGSRRRGRARPLHGQGRRRPPGRRGEQGHQDAPDRDAVPQQPEASGASDAEVAAEAEEARVAGALAALPKDASPEQKADAVGKRPAGLDAARAGQPDDLTRIKGIGPGNSQRLNGLGIYHFDQIAAWTRDEVTWVGTYLAFPGRIDREDWVGQAKALSATGA